MQKILNSYPGIPCKIIGIGEGGIFDKPTIVSTVLGSCIAVTFYYPKEKIGGTFHAIYNSLKNQIKPPQKINPYTYVDSAIDYIIESFHRRGVSGKQLIVKVFGGADAFPQSLSKPGELNYQSAFETLENLNLRILASDVGGNRGRKLLFVTHTGEVYVKLQEGLNNAMLNIS